MVEKVVEEKRPLSSSSHLAKKVESHRFWLDGDLPKALTLAALFCEEREPRHLLAEYDNAGGWAVVVIV